MSSLDAVLFEAGLCQVWLFKTTDVEKVSPDAFGSSWWPLCVWIIIAAPGTTVSCHSQGNNGFKIKLCCRSITTASYELTHRKASYQKSKDETNKLFILMSQKLSYCKTMHPWLEVWGVVADLLDLLWYLFCLIPLNLAVVHWPLLICLWIHSFEIQHLSFDDIMIASYQWIVFFIINIDFWAWFPVRWGNRIKPL